MKAGVKYVSKNHSAFVAMAQTLRNRLKDPYWIAFIKTIDLFIIDEAHKQDFNFMFESGLLEKKHVIGFTATPKRSGKMRQLGLDYEKIIETVSVRWLIKKGYLVNDDPYTIGGVDFNDVKVDSMTGDYQTKSAFAKFNSPKLYAGVVDNYIELVTNTKTLVFCVNIEHSIRTAMQFNEQGIKAKYIVSKVNKPKELKENHTAAELERYTDQMRVFLLYSKTFSTMSGDRDYVFHGHQNGNYPILINAGIATTGYDDKSIETIILNRATLSSTLYLQMIGRGSRIFPNKTHFNILDFGSNIERLGSYSEDREWHLWHDTTEGKGLPPMKTCGLEANGQPIKGSSYTKEGCNRPILAAYKICPFCGFKYPEKEVKAVELTLTASNKSIRSMSHQDLYDYRAKKKHKMPWLWRQLWIKGGEQELDKYAKTYNWSSKTTNMAKNFCRKIYNN